MSIAIYKDTFSWMQGAIAIFCKQAATQSREYQGLKDIFILTNKFSAKMATKN